MSNISISCNINTTSSSAKLMLTIVLDDTVIFEKIIQEPIGFTHELSDDEAEHELKFILTNKKPEHTRLDISGNIIEDACLTINDINFDGTKLDQLMSNLAIYTHNFNGTGETTDEKFYGHMGCNGTVRLKFTTPICLWLLEHV